MFNILSSPERVPLVACATMCIFLHYHVQSRAEQYGATHPCATTCKEVESRPRLGAPPRPEFLIISDSLSPLNIPDRLRPS